METGSVQKVGFQVRKRRWIIKVSQERSDRGSERLARRSPVP